VFLTLARIFEGSRSKTELATRLATGFKVRMIQTQFSDAPATTEDLTRRNCGDAAGLTMAVATPPSATWPALDKNPSYLPRSHFPAHGATVNRLAHRRPGKKCMAPPKAASDLAPAILVAYNSRR
jgi:hypothetical protein